MPDPLNPEELRLIDAWWRAANYLTVGQIYLQENPLLREPLPLETNRPGVFAAGDVRCGSVKRCAAAIGEGSMAVALIHRRLAEVGGD